jgi:hypothetical protein
MRPKSILRKIKVAVCILLLAVGASWQVPAQAKSAPGGFAALPKQQQASLDELEKRTFEFFRDSSNAANGQVPDHWPQEPNSEYFSSIAAIGFGLTAYGIGVERHWMTRTEAAKRTLATLRFFHDAPQSDASDATGNHGFFYHFLDMQSGQRYGAKSWVELSSIDTAELMGGVLFSLSYFDRNTKEEVEIRKLADEIYRRVDWQWFTGGSPLIEGGWTPEAKFDLNYYRGYSEAMLMYIFALGSPTHALGAESWQKWAETYDNTWGNFQGQEHLGGGPMFWHQYGHVWIDFRGIQDEYMRKRGIDYFTNSQRATLAQREYAIHNPMQWADYGANIWGITACNGPRQDLKRGEVDRYVNDAKTFYGYIARGVGLHYNVDDGTIAPTAAVSSIAFVPAIVIPAIEEMKKRYGDSVYTRYGFIDAFNPSFTFVDRPLRTGHIVENIGWVDTLYLGIDQGPIVAMLENYRSDFVWKVMRKNPYVRDGLKRAGFTGGWLDKPAVK